MITKTAEELYRLIKKILLAYDADERNADCLADHLVSSHLCGVDTHGIGMLPRYIDAIKHKYINPRAWPEILNETSTSAKIVSNETFGQVAAKFATETAVEKAAQHNIAVVALTHAHHIGRLGFYTEYAAQKGMISMIFAAGFAEIDPIAVPHGGKKRVLHANPIAMGFPAGKEPPFIVDFSTTASSRVKVVYAQRRNQQVPLGWVVDKDGNPTTDPNDFLEGGSLLPFGGHKGFALMLATEYLGRIFTCAEKFTTQGWDGPTISDSGVTIIAFKANIFDPIAEYKDKADELEQRVRNIPPAPGFEEVLIPGDLERRTTQKRRREGIPIHEDVWQPVNELLAALDIKV